MFSRTFKSWLGLGIVLIGLEAIALHQVHRTYWQSRPTEDRPSFMGDLHRWGRAPLSSQGTAPLYRLWTMTLVGGGLAVGVVTGRGQQHRERDRQQLRSLRQQLATVQEQYDTVQITLDRHHHEQAELHHTLHQFQAIQAAAQAAIAAKDKQLQHLQAQLNQYRHPEYDVIELTAAFEDLTEEQTQLENDNQLLRAEISDLRHQLWQLRTAPTPPPTEIEPLDPEPLTPGESWPLSQLANISTTQAVQALKRLGFEVDHQTGSHIILKRPKRSCTIPEKSEVRPGTLKSALQQAGVSLEEFLEQL
ncbi:type II toxin-antitoxin system HicA family toxin [Spirulina major CS-329]|uniref:type II toxin-antitoxin system HicA family toxin n=1 Tax=Spirulina TaxID=1154 RepID=UPI00232BD1C9|nr:type II toxin-antitoxin system HicA family toxin [Spirulina subsalsa]MDB9494835.1 type II toxin-antitoxin system HicA family toxin [Spirulina subsalsa CS-330]MDB9502912.1 type II toxin-antitoxin system HicA family toxin [Spirulina major CS-329]